MAANIFPPKILIISTCHGAGSGAEKVLEYLLQSIPNKFRSHLAVASPHDSSIYEAASALEYCTIEWPTKKCTFLQNFQAFTSVRRHISRLSFTHIHAWHGRGFEWGLMLAGNSKGITGTLHDHPTSHGHSPVRQKMLKFSANQFDTVVCVSEAQKKACTDNFWATNLVVINNGLPALPEKLCPPPDGVLRVAFLGCTEAWKGASVVLSLAKATKKLPYQWNFYGDITPGSLPNLTEKISSLSPKAQWHGRKAISEIFADNHIVFHPSLKFDPYPTVLLEAARAGIPTISSLVGGSAEIVAHGESGFLFEDYSPDKLLKFVHRLAVDKALYSSLSSNAKRTFLSRFQSRDMSQKYLALWNLSTI